MKTWGLTSPRVLAVLLTIGGVASCTRDERPNRCQFGEPATWSVQLASSETGDRLEGTLTVSTGGAHVTLTGVSGEGTREPMDYPVDSLVTDHDSIHVKFAPLGVKITGRCITRDSVAAQYTFPWPSPSAPIVGTGFLRRVR